MGEPIPKTHTRHHEYRQRPVSSAVELADYAEWLIDLVRQSGEVEPSTRLDIEILGREREVNIPLDELRERSDEFPFSKAFQISLEIEDAGALTLSFKINEAIIGSGPSLKISGTDQQRVQGIKVRIKEEDDARDRALREVQAKAATEIGDVAGAIFEAEAKRERDRQKPARPKARPPTSAQPEPEPEKSKFKRFINHPWTIGIGLTVLSIIGTVLVTH